MTRKIMTCLFGLLCWFMQAQPSIALTEHAQVSVLTCGPAPAIYALFGHTALRVKDPAQQLDVVFNFGTFDFDTPHFALKFVKGDLQYFLSVSGFDQFVAQYVYEGRSVREQVLAFNTQQKQKLFQHLMHRLQGPKKYYTYRFIDRNCTRLAIEEVEAVLPGFHFKKTENPGSYRQQIYPYFNAYFWENLGISLVFGYKTDQPSSVIFLPDEWERSLAQSQYRGMPLVSSARTWVVGPTALEKPTPWASLGGYAGLVILGFVWRKSRSVLLMLTGLLGCICVGVSVYSQHPEVWVNPQILLFNPLWIGLFRLPHWKQGLMVQRSMLLLWAWYGFWLVGKAHWMLMLPWWLGIGWVWWSQWRRYPALLPFVKQNRV